jgi:hypothetical protein
MTAVATEHAPDYIEPLEAWRVWHVVENGGEPALRSVVKPTIWPERVPLVATCLRLRLLPRFRRRNGHDVPGVDCECGIYATTLERLGQYASETAPFDVVARIVGRVALWGTVVECERGYRASHAYPLELFVPWTEKGCDALDRYRLADRLEAAYQVPARLVNEPPGRVPGLLASTLSSLS